MATQAVQVGDVRFISKSHAPPDWENEATLEGLDGWWGLVIDVQGSLSTLLVYDITDRSCNSYKFDTDKVARMRTGGPVDLAVQSSPNSANNSRNNVLTEVRDVPGKGKGLFARSDLPKRTFVGVYSGTLFPMLTHDYLVNLGKLSDTYAAESFMMATVDSPKGAVAYPLGHYIVNPVRINDLRPAHRINEPTGRNLHNCMWVWNLDKVRLEIWTEDAIPKDTELTLCYGPVYQRETYTAPTCNGRMTVSPRRYIFSGSTAPLLQPNHIPVRQGNRWFWAPVNKDGTLKKTGTWLSSTSTSTSSNTPPPRDYSQAQEPQRRPDKRPFNNMARTNQAQEPQRRPDKRPFSNMARPTTTANAVEALLAVGSNLPKYVYFDVPSESKNVLFPILGDRVGSPKILESDGRISSMSDTDTLILNAFLDSIKARQSTSRNSLFKGFGVATLVRSDSGKTSLNIVQPWDQQLLQIIKDAFVEGVPIAAKAVQASRAAQRASLTVPSTLPKYVYFDTPSSTHTLYPILGDSVGSPITMAHDGRISSALSRSMSDKLHEYIINRWLEELKASPNIRRDSLFKGFGVATLVTSDSGQSSLHIIQPWDPHLLQMIEGNFTEMRSQLHKLPKNTGFAMRYIPIPMTRGGPKNIMMFPVLAPLKLGAPVHFVNGSLTNTAAERNTMASNLVLSIVPRALISRAKQLVDGLYNPYFGQAKIEPTESGGDDVKIIRPWKKDAWTEITRLASEQALWNITMQAQ